MRLGIHNKIGLRVCNEINKSGYYVNKSLFLLGNIYPELFLSYFWNHNEHRYSGNYVHRKIELQRKRPRLFSFHLDILTHNIYDFFDSHDYNSYYTEIVSFNFLQAAY